MWEVPPDVCPNRLAPLEVVERPDLRTLSHVLEPPWMGGGSQI